MSKLWWRKGEIWGVTALAAVLMLTNLRHALLWQDEAQTALISRTVCQGGIPRGTDGLNFFSQELGAEYGENHVWRWHTWLPFYAVAASFSLFGEGTFSARLPFACAGILTIPATWWLGRLLWREKRAALAAAALLAVCVPFLILSRQCRYYSFAALFHTVALAGYMQIRTGRRGGMATLAGGLFLLFQTHYLYTATLGLAIGLHLFLLRRSDGNEGTCDQSGSTELSPNESPPSQKGVLLRTGGALAISFVGCLPWVIWLAGMKYPQNYADQARNWLVTKANFFSFVSQIETHLYSVWLCEAIFLLAVWHGVRGTFFKGFDRPTTSGTVLIGLVIAINLGALSVTAPAPFFRYLAPLIPVGMVVAGRMVSAAASLHWLAGVAMAGVMALRPELVQYGKELTDDFQGPVEGIVAHLRQHARESDVVGITYDDLPIKFYTRHRVVGGLTGESLEGIEAPDWIILRRTPADQAKEAPVRRFFHEQTQKHRYEQVVLDVPDTPWQNREDPQTHLYQSATTPPRVIVWRKVVP